MLKTGRPAAQQVKLQQGRAKQAKQSRQSKCLQSMHQAHQSKAKHASRRLLSLRTASRAAGALLGHAHNYSMTHRTHAVRAAKNIAVCHHLLARDGSTRSKLTPFCDNHRLWRPNRQAVCFKQPACPLGGARRRGPHLACLDHGVWCRLLAGRVVNTWLFPVCCCWWLAFCGERCGATPSDMPSIRPRRRVQTVCKRSAGDKEGGRECSSGRHLSRSSPQPRGLAVPVAGSRQFYHCSVWISNRLIQPASRDPCAQDKQNKQRCPGVLA